MEKQKSLELHGKKRLKERFDFPPVAYDVLLKQILTGKSVFLKKQSNRVSHHLVWWDGTQIVAVYDKLRHKIITVLRR